jgi:hypothetical protein
MFSAIPKIDEQKEFLKENSKCTNVLTIINQLVDFYDNSTRKSVKTNRIRIILINKILDYIALIKNKKKFKDIINHVITHASYYSSNMNNDNKKCKLELKELNNKSEQLPQECKNVKTRATLETFKIMTSLLIKPNARTNINNEIEQYTKKIEQYKTKSKLISATRLCNLLDHIYKNDDEEDY